MLQAEEGLAEAHMGTLGCTLALLTVLSAACSPLRRGLIGMRCERLERCHQLGGSLHDVLLPEQPGNADDRHEHGQGGKIV